MSSVGDDSKVGVWDLVEKKCTVMLKMNGRQRGSARYIAFESLQRLTFCISKNQGLPTPLALPALPTLRLLLVGRPYHCNTLANTEPGLSTKRDHDDGTAMRYHIYIIYIYHISLCTYHIHISYKQYPWLLHW